MLRLTCWSVVLLNLAVVAVLSADDEYSKNDFPPDFVFGAASSAYQVEGAANEDGRSPSVWDTFAHQGKAHGATGDRTVDGYHKYKEDVQLMVKTGLDAYRFSISWSRLIPNGRGPINPKGLKYYNNLINELVSHGIQPHVTLFHYDLPQALEDEYGGWLSRNIVKDFTFYADVCFREFGDRVSYWSTLNEPNSLAVGGYDLGFFPPGRCSPPFGVNCSGGNSSSEPYLAAHHLLLAHASAAKLYKKRYQGRQNGFVGITLYTYCFVPQTNSTEDAIAVERAHEFLVGWFVNPLVFGDYPDIMKKNIGLRLPAFTDQESKLVTGSFDFLGLIYYAAIHVQDNSDTINLQRRDFNDDMGVKLNYFEAVSAYEVKIKFPIWPSGLQEVLGRFKEAYRNPPIYIHENGQLTHKNSSLEDTLRVKYLHAYIGGLLDSMRNGSNTRGYFVWSFLDMFELIDGYESSYGLFYVDFDDPELNRLPKLSAHWYANFLRGGNVISNGIIEFRKNLSVLPHEQLPQ